MGLLLDSTDPMGEGLFEAFVRARNDRGGIRGRQVVLHVAGYNPYSAGSADAACTTLLEEAGVFLVIMDRADEDAVRCVSERYGAPVVARSGLDAGLDAGTAYEIVSIDIADIDVGENIGAVLMANQAEAEKRRAQAEAEAQRARAVARGQEMIALGKENQAKVILAEAAIPKAIAEAFKTGNLGVMDYYNLRNVQADTDMRKSLSNEDDEIPDSGATT